VVRAAPAQTAAKAAGAGLFTAAQAARGKAVYAQACAACHGISLTDGAPPLAGPAFEASWGHPDMTVDDLLYLARTTMPPRAAATVPVEDHIAAVAYILQANGYKAGTAVLGLQAPGLKQRLTWAGKAGGAGAARAAAPETTAADAGAAPGTSGPRSGGARKRRAVHRLADPQHDYAGTRFSPLDQINTANVGSLAPACMFQREAIEFLGGAQRRSADRRRVRVAEGEGDGLTSRLEAGGWRLEACVGPGFSRILTD
jgi:cytochrome c5